MVGLEPDGPVVLMVLAGALARPGLRRWWAVAVVQLLVLLVLLTALFGFNCGVEIGQLTVVVPTVPILLWVRKYKNWGKWYEPGLSLLIALMGSYWLVTRVLGIGGE